MKTDIVFENLVVGQKLYSIRYGDCTFSGIGGGTYPMLVEFDCIGTKTYAKDGFISITDENPDLFLTNPFEKNQERVIEVGGVKGVWHRRVCFKIVNDLAICWMNAQTIEEAKNEFYTECWQSWRELQPEQPTAQPKEITLDGVEYVLTPKVK